jgi:phosphohistidine phosphatase
VPRRRLVLIRHAQAGDAAIDLDRPLTERGQQQAAAVGEWLARTGIAPDRVLVSPALRARQTWERARAALACAPEPDVEERIYDNTVDGLVEVIRESPEDVQTLVLVAHNPAVGTLGSELDDGEGSEPAQQTLAAGFPPASVALFGVEAPFAVLGPGQATLLEVVVPAR